MLTVGKRFAVSSPYNTRVCTRRNMSLLECGYSGRLAVGNAAKQRTLPDARLGNELIRPRGGDCFMRRLRDRRDPLVAPARRASQLRWSSALNWRKARRRWDREIPQSCPEPTCVDPTREGAHRESTRWFGRNLFEAGQKAAVDTGSHGLEDEAGARELIGSIDELRGLREWKVPEKRQRNPCIGRDHPICELAVLLDSVGRPVPCLCLRTRPLQRTYTVGSYL